MSHRIRRAVPLAIGAVTLVIAGSGLANASDHHSHHGVRYSSWDEQWLKTAIMGDRFEIEGGRLAVSRATTPTVQALGARLVKDHTKSLIESEHLARRLGIGIPGRPSPSQEWELRTVGAMAGPAFDRAYSDLEVSDHKQDIDEAKSERDEGSNSRVRHSASQELPMLRTHLGLSEQALKVALG
jgi:putative membrane protein